MGLLMLLMKVYGGTCIFLIHDGGEREVGVQRRLIYGGETSLLTLRRGVKVSFGVEYNDYWDEVSDGE